MDIYKHLTVSESERDTQWETTFLPKLKDIKIDIISPDPQEGPDNWPYMFVQSNENGQDFLLNIFDWCMSRGIGVALNPQKQVPDYVFTYGMVWSFIKFGRLDPPLQLNRPGQVLLEEGTQVISGPPTEEFLPQDIRKVLAEFWSQQGVPEMKVLVLSKDGAHFDLCFSLDSLGHPETTEHIGICEAISWFLPSNYNILLIKEEGLPEFTPLV